MVLAGLLAGDSDTTVEAYRLECASGSLWTLAIDPSARGNDDGPINSVDLGCLTVAVDALNERDIEPFASLIADDMIWEGERQGWPWRRFTPS